MSRGKYANGVAQRRHTAGTCWAFPVDKDKPFPKSIRSVDAIRGARSRPDGAIDTRSDRSSCRPARALDPAQTRKPSRQDARAHEIRLLRGRPRLPDRAPDAYSGRLAP